MAQSSSSDPSREEIIELLEWIKSWMISNDYECGPEGEMVLVDIRSKLDRYAGKDPNDEDN